MHRRENFNLFFLNILIFFSFISLFLYFLYPVTGGKIKGWSLADSLICHFLLKTVDSTEENKNLRWWIPASKSLFWPWARIWVFVSHITAKCPAPQNYFGLYIYSCIIFFLFVSPSHFCSAHFEGHETPWFFRTGKESPLPLFPFPDMKNLTSVKKWKTLSN